MNDPEIDYLRKRLEDLSARIEEQNSKCIEDIAYLRGWRSGLVREIDHIQAQINILLAALIGTRPPCDAPGRNRAEAADASSGGENAAQTSDKPGTGAAFQT